jgi:hypothetical protein
MQDADLDSVNDGLSEALASIPADPAPEPVATEVKPESSEGPSRDERGRFAGKEPEAKTEPKTGDGEDRDGGQIPSWRLREIREERDRIAAERDQDRQKLQALERERALWQQRQRQQWEAAQAPPRPDPINDPDAFAEYVEGIVTQRVQSVEESNRNNWVNLTFAAEHEAHGDAFEKAMAALEATRNPQIVADIREAVNPGKALMRWHRQETARREVGDDIEGYNKRLRDKLKADPEFRKEFMAELDAEARGNSGRSSDNVTSLPSLNRASGSAGNQKLGQLANANTDAEIYSELTARRR